MILARYCVEEALASLVRGGRAAAMSMGTIAIAFLALGGFLLITANLQRAVQQWMDSAEVSVFLTDDVSDEARAAIETRLRQDPSVVRVDALSKAAALERFRTDFPELADIAAADGENPFPASFEVRLQPGPDVADVAEALSAAVASLEGVADVQFDRRWLERVLSLLAGVRLAGLAVTVVLLLGAAFTVAAVVRLSLHARRDELGIMQLVGAPGAYIRGPFVVEGMFLGGIGALLAVLVLALAYQAFRGSVGAALAGLPGGQAVTFLGWRDVYLLMGAGLAVGALAGAVASRAAR